MVYPAKTDRATILSAAVEQLCGGGFRSVSLRGVAASLGLAPNALYRYFPDRSHLDAALSAESARRLEASLRLAVGKKQPERALRCIARAYMAFAHEQSAFYEVLMMPCPLAGEDAAAHQHLWLFVVEQVARVTGTARAPEAAVALWAFLHGMTGLKAAGVFDTGKPASSFDYGLKAWIAFASTENIP